MGLNRYEIFLKVAEVGNITRAAELLHYTQAGVSHSIAALERGRRVCRFRSAGSHAGNTDRKWKAADTADPDAGERSAGSGTVDF